jgi:hypothetical protein
MKTKKCRKCGGSGFTFGKDIEVDSRVKRGFGLYEKGIRITCTKCFGKGSR